MIPINIISYKGTNIRVTTLIYNYITVTTLLTTIMVLALYESYSLESTHLTIFFPPLTSDIWVFVLELLYQPLLLMYIFWYT
jgi:hypothetical protein